MGEFHVTSTNHVGIVVEDLDRFANIMTGLFDYRMVDRGGRDVRKQELLTGCKGADVEIAYLKGGGFTIEIQCYAKRTPGTKAYKPRVVDVGHWHLSINVEDLEAIRKRAGSYGLTEEGEEITVSAGPNKGNKILFLRTPEGVVLELTEKHKG